jgi:oligopeptide transport system substrate-binding protein
MLRLLSIPAALILLLVGAIAWSSSDSQPRADFTFCIPRDVITLDPNQMSYLQDFRLAYCIWEGLYMYDGQTLDPVPGVASSVETSADKRVYTFHLRPEAKWSNGDVVVAGDFVFAWRRMLESPGEYSYLHYYIKGAEPYLHAYADFLADPDKNKKPDFSTVGVKAIDPHKLRVELENPVLFFLELMGMPAFFPLHEPSMRQYREVDPRTGNVTYNRKFTRPGMVGNGPFILKTWEFKRRVRLEKSPTYWDRAHVPSNSIEQLCVEDMLGEVLRYEAGDCDWIPEVSSEVGPEMVNKGRRDIHIFPGFGSYYLTLMLRPKFKDGSDNPLFDLRVRQALAMAFEKETICNNIMRMGEKPATTYIPPTIFPGFNVKPGYPFDPKRAKELLDQTAYRDAKTLPGVSILYSSNTLTFAAMAQNIANQWRANLGLAIPVEQQETKVRRERVNNKEYSITIGDWIGDYQDPSTFTDKMLSTSVNNDSAWENKEFDRLCADATRETDPQKRYRLLERANELIDKELSMIPLYYNTNQYLFRDNVHGINFNPRNMTMFKGVYVDRAKR